MKMSKNEGLKKDLNEFNRAYKVKSGRGRKAFDFTFTFRLLNNPVNFLSLFKITFFEVILQMGDGFDSNHDITSALTIFTRTLAF